jgi:hypothetical protein
MMKFSSAALVFALLALANSVSAERTIGQRRRKLRPGGEGKGKGSESETCFLSTTDFCELAGAVVNGAGECADYADLNYCPTQGDICDETFTIASYCQGNGNSACAADCELTVAACCDVASCDDTCLEAEQVCNLLDLFTCPNTPAKPLLVNLHTEY